MKKNFFWGVGLAVFCLLVLQFGISAQSADMEDICTASYNLQNDIAGLQYTTCHSLCKKMWANDADKKEACDRSCQKQYEKDLQNAEDAYERCLEAWGGDPAEPGWDTTPNE